MRAKIRSTTSVKDDIDIVKYRFVQYIIQFSNVRRHDAKITR